jgi:serine/threonine-protein kinase
VADWTPPPSAVEASVDVAEPALMSAAAVIDIPKEEPTQLTARADEATQLVARADEPTQTIVETSAPAARSEIVPPPSLRPETIVVRSLVETPVSKPDSDERTRFGAREPVAESPFGSAPIPTDTAPLQSGASARAGSAQRSGAGMYALLAVLAVAIVGGGGAYMGGLLDFSSGGEVVPQPIVTDPPVTDATDPDPKPDVPPGDTVVVTPPATDTTPPATDTTTPPVTDTTQPPVIDTTEPPATDQTTPPANDEIASLEPDDTEGANPPAANSDACFFAAITTESDDAMAIKGFGLSTAPFEKIRKALADSGSGDAKIEGHVINEPQCAVTDFLKAVQPKAIDSPRITLAAADLKLGDSLKATITDAGTNNLDLLLIDGDGFVHDMKDGAELKKDGASDTLAMNMTEPRSTPNSPEMIVAITSPDGLKLPKIADKTSAADLFPKLTKTLLGADQGFGIDFAYFRLSQ